MTPNEMRALKAETGRPLSELLGGDLRGHGPGPGPDPVAGLGRARGAPVIDVSWDEAGDVLPDMTEVTPDPTRTGNSNNSSISAVGGG